MGEAILVLGDEKKALYSSIPHYLGIRGGNDDFFWEASFIISTTLDMRWGCVFLSGSSIITSRLLSK